MLSQLKWTRVGLTVAVGIAVLSGGLAWAKKPVKPPPDPEPEPPFTYVVTWLGTPAGHLESFTCGMNDENDLGEVFVVGKSTLGSNGWADTRAFVSYVVNEEPPVTVDLNTLVDAEEVETKFGEGYVLVVARDINNLGQITGLAMNLATVETGSRAFRFNLVTGLLENLGTFEGHRTYGVGINDLGDVVGMYMDVAEVQRAFLYSDSLDLDEDGVPGGMTDLGDLNGPVGTEVFPKAINEFGQVTGWVQGLADYPYRSGFLYTPLSGMVPLSDGPAEFTYAYGMNDAGMVVGNGIVTYQVNRKKTRTEKRAMRYNVVTGEITDFADPPDCWSNSMYGINNKGEIVGYASSFLPNDFPYIYFNDTDGGWNLNDLAGDELGIFDIYVSGTGFSGVILRINEQSQIGATSSMLGGPKEAILLTPVYPEQ